MEGNANGRRPIWITRGPATMLGHSRQDITHVLLGFLNTNPDPLDECPGTTTQATKGTAVSSDETINKKILPITLNAHFPPMALVFFQWTRILIAMLLSSSEAGKFRGDREAASEQEEACCICTRKGKFRGDREAASEQEEACCICTRKVVL
ncbi:UNVERIFIED_CONTAM: hypothetical protein FKN15_050866 [Acipenser sinensis]